MQAINVFEKNSVHLKEVQKDSLNFDDKQMHLIRQMFCKDATNDEFLIFIEVCKAKKLNPLDKQIYFIKRGGAPTYQTSIDGLRLIADRTNKYSPGRESTFSYDEKGALVSATSYVKKMSEDGTWHEVGSTAFWSEYNAGANLWKKMPHIMLAKCAEANALRKAFPADMMGLYAKEEMDQANIEPPIDITEQNISPEQADEIYDLIDEDLDLLDRILKGYKVEKMTQIPAKNFPLIMRNIKTKRGVQ
jgi:phage recombination protein Bet